MICLFINNIKIVDTHNTCIPTIYLKHQDYQAFSGRYIFALSGDYTPCLNHNNYHYSCLYRGRISIYIFSTQTSCVIDIETPTSCVRKLYSLHPKDLFVLDHFCKNKIYLVTSYLLKIRFTND